MTIKSALKKSVVIVAVIIVFFWAKGIVSAVQQARQDAIVSQSKSNISQIRLAMLNYKTITGTPLARVTVDSDGKLISWRETLAFHSEDLFGMGGSEHEEHRASNNTNESEAPYLYRIARSADHPVWTNAVAIYKESDGSEDEAVSPWVIAMIPDTKIPWREPRDMSVDEFKEYINSPAGRSYPIVFMGADLKLGTIKEGHQLCYSRSQEGIIVELFHECVSDSL